MSLSLCSLYLFVYVAHMGLGEYNIVQQMQVQTVHQVLVTNH